MKNKLKGPFKITIYIVLLLLLLVLLCYQIVCGNKVLKSKNITYTKVSDMNYITYLKNNSHYDSSYLGKEFNLVANLIDYFNLDYNYSYSINEKIGYKLTYSIDAILEIYDSDSADKPIEKKVFNIVKKDIEGNSQTIKVDIYNQKIDYNTYDKIVQSWKKEISPSANLMVLINVNWSGYSKTLKKDIYDKCVTKFVIPISEKTINIKSPNNIDKTGTIQASKKLPWWYIVSICSTSILLLLDIICIVTYVVQLNKCKSKYEQKVNKILREFDRAITEANGKFHKSENEDYIEVKNFMELLDVHDNVNEPIIYYKNSNDLSIFVIKNGHDNYYTKIKRSDFEN